MTSVFDKFIILSGNLLPIYKVPIMKQEVANLSPTTFGRLPNYLRVLKKLSNDGLEYISSVGLSEEVNENPAVVKKIFPRLSKSREDRKSVIILKI